MILGIDYGRKRVGIAVAQHGWVFEREALATLPAEDFFQALQKIVQEEQVTRIVVGMPYGLTNKNASMALEVQDFIEGLSKRLNVPVESWDERLTTAEAKRQLHAQDVSREDMAKRKDSLSAKIMLESYIAAHPEI